MKRKPTKEQRVDPSLDDGLALLHCDKCAEITEHIEIGRKSYLYECQICLARKKSFPGLNLCSSEFGAHSTRSKKVKRTDDDYYKDEYYED